MIKSDHRASLVIAYLGYAPQNVGVFPPHGSGPPPEFAVALVFVGGTALVVTGLALGLRAKGRLRWWSLVGIIPLLGIWIEAVILHRMEDRAPSK